MKQNVAMGKSNVAGLSTLSELLDLLAKLSQLSAPLNTADGLRSAIDLLVQLGDLIGLDSDWLAWLEGVLENPAVFNLALAIVGYLSSILEPAQPAPATNDRAPNAGAPVTAQAIPIAVWLSLIAEITQFVQKLRAKQ